MQMEMHWKEEANKTNKGMEESARKLNMHLKCCTKNQSNTGIEVIELLKISFKANKELESINHTIEESFKKLEKEIDETFEDAKNLDSPKYVYPMWRKSRLLTC